MSWLSVLLTTVTVGGDEDEHGCATRLRPCPAPRRSSVFVVERCERSRDSEAPDGYRDGLALCVIDSIQSTGATYSSIISRQAVRG
ncbi:hypothetical protein [Mycobacterium branderi]|uniref:Uncharacterized protein n=1 Tax=Mycobacterium branderi TaxID=43348 RepID=A0AA91LRQ5_9MYCO|nr:hypothetical protein [Mycobacterium branderi]ORA31253.1 hypothetical protein BST20_27315 [Mycobacterium branderi]